jgi:hypothetical protein
MLPLLPLFKAMVQIIFCNTAQELRRFFFRLFYQHKMGSIEHGFGLWKKEEVAGIKIRQLRGVSKHSDVFTR